MIFLGIKNFINSMHFCLLCTKYLWNNKILSENVGIITFKIQFFHFSVMDLLNGVQGTPGTNDNNTRDNFISPFGGISQNNDAFPRNDNAFPGKNVLI